MNKQQLKAKYKNEKVFAVPYDKLHFIGDKFTETKHDSKIWSMFDSLGEFVYRYDAEGAPELQQIIPYILIANENGDKLFTTRRIAGETRLVNKLSMACGGHINPCDGSREVLFKAAVRELFEEVNIETNKPFEIIGFVRDVNSSTNDHTGVVIVAKAIGDVTVKENENLVGKWMTIDELVHEYENLEGWSKYVLDYFVTNKGFSKSTKEKNNV